MTGAWDEPVSRDFARIDAMMGRHERYARARSG